MVKKNKERANVTSCGAVVCRHDGRGWAVLLIKQFANKNRWGIPKGHVKEGEAFEAAAIREVREETGVLVELGEPLPNMMVTSKHEVKTIRSWTAVVVGDHSPKLDDPENEVADAGWFLWHELPPLVSYQEPFIKSTLQQLAVRWASYP